LSESLSFSLFALFIAGVILELEQWQVNFSWSSRVDYIFNFSIVLIATLFSFSRDSNTFLILSFFILFFLFMFLQGKETDPRSFIQYGLLVSLGLIFIIQISAASRFKRWFVPYRNVFYARILQDEDASDYFIQAGMPLNAEEADTLGNYPRREFMNYMDSPAGAEINAWLEEQGRSVYIRWLGNNPIQSLKDPLHARYEFFLPDSSEYRKPIQPQPHWLEVVSESLFPHSVVGLSTLVLLPGIISVPVFFRLKWRTLLVVPYTLLASVYPLMFIVFHADAIELERHAAQISLQVRLSGWLLIIFLMDYWVSRLTSLQSNRR
jgi:hypothetical protein